jgi:membrane-associated phospholipid phosphatase
MSTAGEVEPVIKERGPSVGWRLLANAQAWFALIGRPPRNAMRPAWRRPEPAAIMVLVALGTIAITMALIDAPLIGAMQGLPLVLVEIFNRLTDFGTSDWFLVPIGLLLIVIAAAAPPALTHVGRLVLAAFTVRLGFVFAAIALPGLVVTIGKRLIGRARPFVGGEADPFLYRPFIWLPDYASLPSGHATNVFAALIAVGLVWPRWRIPMLIYALIIAASRVIVLAHHPSDVIAGAFAGAFGALMVRDWFAARRLGFAIDPKGRVRTLPGPSLARLKAVAREFRAQ